MIKMRCVVECDECEKQEPMTITIKGELDIGKERTLHVDSISLPGGWREFRENHYYGEYDDKTLCAKCYEPKKKAWER